MSHFKVTPHEEQPLRWWASQNERELLDLDPRYQRRGNLWSQWKKAHLIDSVLNDFDIPKLYVADFTRSSSKELNSSRKPYSIVDGKQRFGAFFEFLKDVYPLNQSFALDENPEVNAAGMRFSEIKQRYPTLADKLETYIPTVMSIVTDDELKITEMFTRLNSGMSTTSAEKRNAIPGPATGVIRQITANRFFMKKIRFNITRMQEFNLAAKIALIEYKGGFTDTKARNLDSFAEQGAIYFVPGFRKRAKRLDAAELDQLSQKYAETEERALYTLDLMAAEFRDRDPLLASQGHIPVYYWLMHEHPELCKGALRVFLEDFTSQVKEALRISRSTPENADPEMMNYYTMGRTTNDQNSLAGRYQILLRHLRAFDPPQRLL